MYVGNSLAPSVLTKEMLLEIGGWRAMQEGRSLWEAGKVMSVDWVDPMLGGVVQAGDRDRECATEIRKETFGCRESV